ncbi:uncharacterized protein LOC119068911 [Bradysia coprophila]|uniref:uncharacterized protein LOC119068911 n=1 Tax=Bradysia coprophila TaxID=38358 RepID=UPI00187DBE5A|nr:uncharacterized protein LOC119068911 [Bradysia coprophila]
MTIKQDFYNADEFWGYVEGKLHCNVPKYIKNILRIKCLDDPISLQDIDDTVIEQLESFVQSGGLTPFIPDNTTDLKEFYGIFHQVPNKFKITVGSKILLKLIVAYVTEQVNTKGPNFYKSE